MESPQGEGVSANKGPSEASNIFDSHRSGRRKRDAIGRLRSRRTKAYVYVHVSARKNTREDVPRKRRANERKKKKKQTTNVGRLHREGDVGFCFEHVLRSFVSALREFGPFFLSCRGHFDRSCLSFSASPRVFMSSSDDDDNGRRSIRWRVRSFRPPTACVSFFRSFLLLLPPPPLFPDRLPMMARNGDTPASERQP